MDLKTIPKPCKHILYCKILPIWIIKHIRMSYNVKILPKRIIKHTRISYNVKILPKRILKPPQKHSTPD